MLSITEKMMAKIDVSFDTSDKKLEVTLDGKKMKNVSAVEFFKSFMDDGSFFAEIRTVETKEDDDITVVTRIMADSIEERVEKDDSTIKNLSDSLLGTKYE